MPNGLDADPAARAAALVRVLEGLSDNAPGEPEAYALTEEASALETVSIDVFEQDTLQELLASL